jgi:hypothetical protein
MQHALGISYGTVLEPNVHAVCFMPVSCLAYSSMELLASKSLQLFKEYVLVSFLFFWSGVRLSPLGIQPIVPAKDDKWWCAWGSRWYENWQGKQKYSEKTYPSATSSTTNPTWPDLGSKPGRCGGIRGNPAFNRLCRLSNARLVM